MSDDKPYGYAFWLFEGKCNRVLAVLGLVRSRVGGFGDMAIAATTGNTQQLHLQSNKLPQIKGFYEFIFIPNITTAKSKRSRHIN